MSTEIQVTASITYAKNGVGSYARSVSALNVTQSGNNMVDGVLSVAASDTTIPLSPVTGTLGWAWFHNLDVSSTINIKTASSGTIIASMLPGEVAFFRIGSGVTAPAAISSSGTVLMEYQILTA